MKTILIFFLLFFLFSCSNSKESKENFKNSARTKGNFKNRTKSNEPKKNRIRTIPVFRTNITQILKENGSIEPEKEPEVKSRISGRVTSILVDEGDKVKRGQVIAKIEPNLQQIKTISSITKRNQQLQINLENKKRDFDRNKDLFNQGFISEDTYKDSKDDYQIALVEYNSLKREIEVFKEEIGSKKGLKIKRLSVVSPITGVIISKNVEEGEIISGDSSTRSGSTLFKIANVSKLVAKITLSEIDIYKVYINQKATLSITASPNKVYNGFISKIAPRASSKRGVKVFPIEIKINQQDNRLRPGMSARVDLIVDTRKNIIAIPLRCLYANNNLYYVFKKTKQKTEKQQVFIGAYDYSNVEITKGLIEGDIIHKKISREKLEELSNLDLKTL